MTSSSMNMNGFTSPYEFFDKEKERQKVSRNKRKFRSDPLPPLSLAKPNSCSECVSNPQGNKDFANPNSWKLGCNSTEPSDIDGQKDFPSVSDSHLPYFEQCKCATLGEAKGLGNANSGYGCNGFSRFREKEDKEIVHLQEADWNNTTESELEELLLNNLDAIYKSAIKRVASYGFEEEVALTAVLRYGKCYGSKDALSSIVDNTLMNLRNPGDANFKDQCFEDLQELEKHVVEQMVSLVREVRPGFSDGDAMWCLLISDMNIAHACAVDDDSYNGLNKEAFPANPSLMVPGKCSSETSLPAMSSVISNSTSSFRSGSGASPFANRTAVESNSPMPFIAESSSFTMGAFAMPGSMLHGSCRHHNTVESINFGVMQSEHCHPSCREVNSLCSMHTEEAVLSGIQSSMTFTSGFDNGSVPASSGSDITAENFVLSMAQPFQKAKAAGHGSKRSENNTKNNACATKGSTGSLFPPSRTLKKFASPELKEFSFSKISSSMNASPFQGIENQNSACTSVRCSDTSSFCQRSSSAGPQQTEFLAKGVKSLDETEFNSSNLTTDSDKVDDVSSIAVARTELSLSLASGSGAGKDVIKDSTSIADDTVDCNHDSLFSEPFHGANLSQDKKDEMILKMYHRAKYLETQIHMWNEWAQEKIMQAAHRLGKDKAELKALRQEKEEAMQLKKGKHTYEESTMKKLSDMESKLRETSHDAEFSIAEAHRLEAENIKLRHGLEAAKIAALKSTAAYQEALNRKNKTSKKIEAWEREKLILQEELATERQKLSQLKNQLAKAREQQHQLENRWKQEIKAKEEAFNHLEAEKRTKEDVDTMAKYREETLLRKAEADSKEHQERMQKLEHEIAQLQIKNGSSKLTPMHWGMNFCSDATNFELLKQANAGLHSNIIEWHSSSQNEIQRDRECVMCLCEEMSVVFLPCAHQVVCKNCNIVHEEQGMKDCPSCRTLIQQRIHVNMA